MKYADEITAIACRWAEMGYDVPDSVHVSTQVYKDILDDYRGQSTSPFPHFNAIEFYSTFGCHRIIVDPQLPGNCIHMNRLTLNDILIDDILLDDANYGHIED